MYGVRDMNLKSTSIPVINWKIASIVTQIKYLAINDKRETLRLRRIKLIFKSAFTIRFLLIHRG